MKLIFKIEDLINKLIFKLLVLVKGLIPKSITHKHEKLKFKSKHFAKKNKVLFLRQLQKLNKQIHHYNNLFFTKADFFKTYPFKEKFEEYKLDLSIYLSSKTRLEIVKDLFFRLSHLMKSSYSNKKVKYSAGAIFSFLFIAALFNNNKFFDNNYREIASSSYKMQRADYKKFTRRTLKVQNVAIPIVVKDKKDIHSFLTDFYVRTDTVFAKLYLDHNQHKIRDRFYENTYRMPASFPLDNDGKGVIKEKIIFELNRLLKDNRVEGKVLEVSLDAPIAN